MSSCGACPNPLVDGEETIACSICELRFHSECVTMPGRLSKTSRGTWTCTVCVAKSRVHDGNFNSPVGKSTLASQSVTTQNTAAPPLSNTLHNKSKTTAAVDRKTATASVAAVKTGAADKAALSKKAATEKSAVEKTAAEKPAANKAAAGKSAAVKAAAAEKSAVEKAAAGADKSTVEDLDDASAPQLYYQLIKGELLTLRRDIEVLTNAVTEYKATCVALQTKNDELTQSLEFLHAEHDAAKKSIAALAARTKRLEDDKNGLKSVIDAQATTIDTMQDQIEEGEQRARAANLEIFGIPERNAERLQTIVMDIAKAAGVTVRHEDMEFVTRVAARPGASAVAAAGGRPKPIIVRFRHSTLKDDVLRAVRKRRGVNTEDIGLPGDKRQVYVNDHLTPAKKALFAKARAASREAGFRHCWTAYTKIYVRRADQSHKTRIRNEKDLANLSKLP